MNLETTVTQTNKLFANFCPELPQKYREEKIKLIHSELYHIHDQAFVNAVEDILSDENVRKFPTIAQLKLYAVKYKKSACDNQQAEGCEKCDRGVISSFLYKERFKRWYRYTFRCTCEAGQKLDYSDAPDVVHTRCPTSPWAS